MGSRQELAQGLWEIWRGVMNVVVAGQRFWTDFDIDIRKSLIYIVVKIVSSDVAEHRSKRSFGSYPYMMCNYVVGSTLEIDK